MTTQEPQGVNWDSLRDEYEGYISSYAAKCPFHLFDTIRERNITRSELKINLYTSLVSWTKIPLTCDEISKAISFVSIPERIPSDEIRPYVVAAIRRNPLLDDEARFIWDLKDELEAYSTAPAKGGSAEPRTLLAISTPSILKILLAVCGLFDKKRAQPPAPISAQDVRDRIALFGQYAILSHRWDCEGEELSFDDVADLSHPSVQAKKGFKKFLGFSKVVKAEYGCRYLWVDSACISEADRNASIPRMFGWYRHAYVCLIYLSMSPDVLEDPWGTRGWTLQEFLAASRIKCFDSDWRTLGNHDGRRASFDACRSRDNLFSPVYRNLQAVAGNVNWKAYKPEVHQILRLFDAMRSRETTIPEDMVYSILSPLSIDIPVEYGEGFNRAFYRLQVKYLTQTGDRRLLSWEGSTSSPHNSMLAGDFAPFDMAAYPMWWSPKNTYWGMQGFDPAISFDPNGVMRIMASLHLLSQSQREPSVFALLGKVSGTCVGVLLRPMPGRLYQRIGIKVCEESNISVEKVPEWICIQ